VPKLIQTTVYNQLRCLHCDIFFTLCLHC